MDNDNAAKIDKRLATIEGHIRAVRKMIEEGKGCVDVITQLMAIERAVKSANIAVLKNHLNGCIKDAANNSERAWDEIQEFNKILEMYL